MLQMHLSAAALKPTSPLLLLQKVTTAVTAAAWGLSCLNTLGQTHLTGIVHFQTCAGFVWSFLFVLTFS